MYSPSKIRTFDEIKHQKHIPHEKVAKMQRKYEKLRDKRANSVLSMYS